MQAVSPNMLGGRKVGTGPVSSANTYLFCKLLQWQKTTSELIRSCLKKLFHIVFTFSFLWQLFLSAELCGTINSCCVDFQKAGRADGCKQAVAAGSLDALIPFLKHNFGLFYGILEQIL